MSTDQTLIAVEVVMAKSYNKKLAPSEKEYFELFHGQYFSYKLV